jgi:hypothetical protein
MILSLNTDRIILRVLQNLNIPFPPLHPALCLLVPATAELVFLLAFSKDELQVHPF